MSSLPLITVSVAEYLENEKSSDVRHEYLAGQVYAMAGVSATHNIIAGNMFSRLRAHLRGGPCRVFISDMKVYIEAIDFFYCPDVVVTRDPQDTGDYFKTRPCLIIEVSSPSTAVTDRREKLLAYQKLDSLREYVLIAQDEVKVEFYARDREGHWWLHTLDPKGELRLKSVGLTMPIAEIYDDVSF
ncbi:MAG TPA: Uma2 family endonuclease [Blastocatellia bacterium]|nr:Uma2 family endonuclease [Blastocatellia bacterium]